MLLVPVAWWETEDEDDDLEDESKCADSDDEPRITRSTFFEEFDEEFDDDELCSTGNE